jgi:hypothetical protein
MTPPEGETAMATDALLAVLQRCGAQLVCDWETPPSWAVDPVARLGPVALYVSDDVLSGLPPAVRAGLPRVLRMPLACEAITALAGSNRLSDDDVPWFAFALGDLDLVDYLTTAVEHADA